MNNLTATVLELQKAEGHRKDELFTEVYIGIQPTIEKVVNRFKYSFRGDAHAGYSVAMEHLIKATEDFKYEGHEFLSFYSKLLRCKMIDLQRKIESDKRKHNTCYDVSLSKSTEEGHYTDSSLELSDGYSIGEDETTVSWLVDKFHEVKPAEAEVLELLIQYSADGYLKKDLTDALAKHYGVEKYNGTVQKRVSRVREAFKKLAVEYGMDFSF